MISETENELVARQPLTRNELAQELERAKLINSSIDVRQKWDELVAWLKVQMGENEANLFISESFSFDDFRTEIRLTL